MTLKFKPGDVVRLVDTLDNLDDTNPRKGDIGVVKTAHTNDMHLVVYFWRTNVTEALYKWRFEHA